MCWIMLSHDEQHNVNKRLVKLTKLRASAVSVRNNSLSHIADFLGYTLEGVTSLWPVKSAARKPLGILKKIKTAKTTSHVAIDPEHPA